MDNQLVTLSKIFTERIFRIPDYQRGYAWTDKQLKDFWGDVEQLGPNNNHYTGVLTLENVPEPVYRQWHDDLWIIEAKSFQPYYIVDGQQRLTTAILLIQVILERLGVGDKLNFTDRADIQRKFIFDSKDDGISRSYIFGYETDNPSYEFLKTRIFCERSSGNTFQETVYTHNLASAKSFFAELVGAMPSEETEILYRKATQQLLFNLFTISEEVDVCVAFETMNNRGKALSYLELLKNRLIYLSLKFDAPDYERRKLRGAINDCWKSVYHNLGRNKDRQLDDDRFLLTHYELYFGQSPKTLSADGSTSIRRRLLRADYARDLLEVRFVPKNVASDAPADAKVTLQEIYRYVSSLQEAVETWYKMWNPFDSDFSPEIQVWLDKVIRLEYPIYQSLILVVLQSEASEAKRLAFLQAVERQLFLISLVGSRIFPDSMIGRDDDVLITANDIRAGRTTTERVTRQLSDRTSAWMRIPELVRGIVERFRSDGYYKWPGLRYFLFEFNLDLQRRSKTDRPKIYWPEFKEARDDFITIEHIFPRQARHAYWTSRFGNLEPRQRTAVRDSLGNLLPLSKPKNSSLSNLAFLDKVEGKPGSTAGYRFGSYAENEIAREQEWTPGQILRRGLRMINFLEHRWNIELGPEEQKIRMLGLDFLENDAAPTGPLSRSRRLVGDSQ